MIGPEILGQRRALRILESWLDSSRLPSAALFWGPEGVGKTLSALAFAKALLCRKRLAGQAPCGSCDDCAAVGRKGHPDAVCVNAAYQAGLRGEEPERQKSLRVETIRHLRKDMEMPSLLGGWKLAIVEDAHTLEEESANALLKIVEEPHPGSLWILVSSQRERLPKTILSRCFGVPFSPLGGGEVRALLERRGLEPSAAARLSALSAGSVSRALELSAEDYPGSLSGGPLAPFAAAEGLPRELFLSRRKVELALFCLGQELRSLWREDRGAFGRLAPALRRLLRLRAALRSNADPRAVLTLACLEAERARS